MGNNIKETIFAAGGGTGGHIYPALAVISELKNRGYENIYYIGNPKNPEFKHARKNNIKFLPVNVDAMPRKMSLSSLFWVIKLFFAIVVCIYYIKKYKPGLIFGTGGYVSAPILFAAKVMKVKYALHDADAQPGIVTRCFSAGAIMLTTPFEIVKSILPAANVEVTGNPIRTEFASLEKDEAKAKLGVNSKLILLVMGGSQGARSINNAVIPIAKRLIDEFNICIFHQSGEKRYDESVELLKQVFPDYEECDNYKLFPYIDDMPTLLKSSDIALSRSGSLSLSEMCASNVASILVPYPYSAGGHQKKNAQVMENLGCSIMIEDADLTSDKLYEVISDLLKNPQRMTDMQKRAQENARPYAAEKITERLISF